MNYNELYRPKDRIRPKRTKEEKQNIRRILLASLLSILAGIFFMGILLAIWLSFR